MGNYYLHENTQVIYVIDDKKYEVWTIIFNGARCKHGCGAGVVFKSLDGSTIRFSFQFTWTCTNNVVEYEALCLGLSKVIIMGIGCLIVYGEFKLVINQVQDKISAKHHYLKTYRNRVWDLLESFITINMIAIPRKYNQVIDSLTRRGSRLNPTF